MTILQDFSQLTIICKITAAGSKSDIICIAVFLDSFSFSNICYQVKENRAWYTTVWDTGYYGKWPPRIWGSSIDDSPHKEMDASSLLGPLWDGLTLQEKFFIDFTSVT